MALIEANDEAPTRHRSNSANEHRKYWPLFVWEMGTMISSARDTGSGRNRSVFATENSAVFAPMPSASVRITDAEKVGTFRRRRTANMKSFNSKARTLTRPRTSATHQCRTDLFSQARRHRPARRRGRDGPRGEDRRDRLDRHPADQERHVCDVECVAVAAVSMIGKPSAGQLADHRSGDSELSTPGSTMPIFAEFFS